MNSINYRVSNTAHTTEELTSLMADFQRSSDLVDALLEDRISYSEIMASCENDGLGNHILSHLFNRASLERQSQGFAPGSIQEQVVCAIGHLMQLPSMTGSCLDQLHNRMGQWSESVLRDIANLLANQCPKSLINTLDITQDQLANPLENIRDMVRDSLLSTVGEYGREQLSKTALDEKKLSRLLEVTEWSEGRHQRTTHDVNDGPAP